MAGSWIPGPDVSPFRSAMRPPHPASPIPDGRCGRAQLPSLAFGRLPESRGARGGRGELDVGPGRVKISPLPQCYAPPPSQSPIPDGRCGPCVYPSLAFRRLPKAGACGRGAGSWIPGPDLSPFRRAMRPPHPASPIPDGRCGPCAATLHLLLGDCPKAGARGELDSGPGRVQISPLPQFYAPPSPDGRCGPVPRTLLRKQVPRRLQPTGSGVEGGGGGGLLVGWSGEGCVKLYRDLKGSPP